MGIAVDNALRDPLDRSSDSFEIALISSSNSTGIQEFHISVLAGGYGISDGNILVFLDIYHRVFFYQSGTVFQCHKVCWFIGNIQKDWESCFVPKVLNLPFREDIAKPNRDNAIDVYIGDTPEDVIGDDVWAETFTEQPAPLTAEEKKAYLSKVTGVCLGSDAFFPFGDNIERARRSGVTAIVQPGGSIRDQQVIDTCNKYGIAMAFCGLRLFHH